MYDISVKNGSLCLMNQNVWFIVMDSTNCIAGEVTVMKSIISACMCKTTTEWSMHKSHEGSALLVLSFSL